MALTNTQIFKMTPKTNCKECGSSTCMGFAMKVYQGNVDISACPYISEEDSDTPTDADKLRADDTRYISGEKILCPDCKNEIKENMNFCPFCGKKIFKKEVRAEEVFISDSTETTDVFQSEGSELIDLYTQNEDMVCPNCGNDIEEGMVVCPFCDEEISYQKEDIKKSCISDMAESNEKFQGEGSELIGLYTQDETNMTSQEGNVEKFIPSDKVLQENSPEIITIYTKNENKICPNCGNDIEKGMITCPFCDEKIPEKEEIVKEKSVSDINEINEARVRVTHTLHEMCEKKKISESPISSGVDDNNGTLQEESKEGITLSSPNEVSVDFQKEILESKSVFTQTGLENTNDKEILEVFTSSDRNKVRRAFEKALVAINKIEDALLKQEKFDQEKDALAKKKQEMEEEMSVTQAWLVLSIIPVLIILLVILTVTNGSLWEGIKGTLVIGGLYCGGVVGIYAVIEDSADPKKKENAKKWYNEQITPLNQKENKFLKEFKDYCESDEFIFVQKIVPEEYFDSESVQYFIKMLKNGRADTYKEVINLYEEHVHRKKMEDMQIHGLKLQGENLEETRQLAQNVKAQNEQLQKQTEYMKEISKNTQSTARAVKVNAFIGAVSGHSQSKKLKQIERNTR